MCSHSVALAWPQGREETDKAEEEEEEEEGEGELRSTVAESSLPSVVGRGGWWWCGGRSGEFEDVVGDDGEVVGD